MNTLLKNHKFMLLCFFLIWLKTFIVSRLVFYFNHNVIEVLVFAINPIMFLFVVFGIGLFIKPIYQPTYYFLIALLLSIILYMNVVYYREFSDIMTLPLLLMSQNMGDLGTSIFTLIQWYDIVFFVDVLLIGFLMLKNVGLTVTQISIKQFKIVVLATVFLLSITLAQFISLDKTHTFKRDQLIQIMGIYNFYIYDTFTNIERGTRPGLAQEDDWDRIKKHLSEHRASPNSEMFNIAQDMNVVVVSLESVESFVIGETLHGEEITPFLNELIEDSFYFNNFYHQTGQGKTSDAELLINHSLYPLSRGAVFMTHYDNLYRALPSTLMDLGYTTASFHANDKTFYNRDVMYENIDYERFYSFDDYDITKRNSVGWGLKDIDFFEQSMEYLLDMPQPFYSTFLTLTNHFPFELDEEDHFIEPFDSDSLIVNQYFPTVRYTDEAMRIFVDRLKQEGLYENTILVIYGDHYGISASHYDELGKFLDKEITLYDEVKLERVPLIIHIPGFKGETLPTISGQIDVMPTLLNLLGIPEIDHTMFGSDLFAEDRKEIAILRNGTVITNELIYVNGICLSYETEEEHPIEKCDSIKERGMQELNFSSKIIHGDLLQFKD